MVKLSGNPEEDKFMRSHNAKTLEGIRESRFEEEFYDLVDEFRYKIHPDYTATTIIWSVGQRQIRVKERKLFGLLTKTFLINFFPTIFWLNEEKTEYKVLYSFDYGYEGSGVSFMGSNGYLKGDDVISVFKEQCLEYQIFMYENY